MSSRGEEPERLRALRERIRKDVEWYEGSSEDATVVQTLNDALAEVGRLAGRVAALETALAEAADWLDVDLAHAPDTPTSMADHSLVASWREVLDVGGSE